MHKCDGCSYKGEHHEMMFRPLGVCNRGANLLEAIKNYEAEKCPYQKTNGERIRAMSDAELADFLESTHTNMAIKLGGEYIVRAKEYIEIWLKQPAEAE